jgi:hypothetical protein
MEELDKLKLILFLSKFNYSENIAIASTLAWLSKLKNYFFDNYFDSYHQGNHFGGGDPRNMETGQLTGGTVSGDRHFEELYFMLHSFDVSVVSFSQPLFQSAIKNLNIPIIVSSDKIVELYKKIFKFLDVSFPLRIVMIGTNFEKAVSGLEAYLYPEIFYREAIGVLDSIPEEDLGALYRDGSKIFCLYMDKNIISRLQTSGYNIEIIDQLRKNDDYLSITKRIALRWIDKAKGWILGDPMLVSHWLPKACEEDLLSLYSVPQNKIISQLGDLISSRGKVIYGRQYSDEDFFELSKLNQCLQVIDPCRPPFQSVKHAEYAWHFTQNEEGFFKPEYTDEELRQFAREGRILVSLIFWSGMIREIENFYNLMELFSITKLRCGIVLTAQSYDYMMHAPLELLTIPLEQGGVYPFVEPLLGSCGLGVGIESYIANRRLQETLNDALSRIFQKVKKQHYMPRGWWPTMDTDLKKLTGWRKPKPIRFLRYSPYFQLRFKAKEKAFDENFATINNSKFKYVLHNYIDRVKSTIIKAGLLKYFQRYRPYESYQSCGIRKDVIDAARAAGLQYMFTKAGFKTNPEAKYIDKSFIALNYTAGQWDGWTPFETVNDVSDLRKSEKILLRRKTPGWIVSTIDSCLWTFSGEFWKRGGKLYEIAQFCSEGGNSRKLINVKPFTISRYARIIAENNS